MVDVNETLAKISNITISDYLNLMDGTETPPIFHAFALISAASACLTRRKYFPLGAIRVVPNQYIWFVGAPGVRKSTAVGFARDLVADVHHLHFGPNNTAGRPQGLIMSMKRSKPGKDAAEDAFNDAVGGISMSMDMGFDIGDTDLRQIHNLDKHACYVAEKELVSFLGKNSDEFTSFLGDMWDKSGDLYYEYNLKREFFRLDLPCLNMLGAITPMHITSNLPPQSIGQGFTSRILMVYSDSVKEIAWPKAIDEKRLQEFKELMGFIGDMEPGPFSHTPEAEAYIRSIYSYRIATEDVRFGHYQQRRQSHMIKIGMALCALRMDTEVSLDDMQDAHALLVLIEHSMPECLGEHGLNADAVARARVTNVLKAAREPLAINRIILACGSDVKRSDVSRALYEMGQADQILEVNLRDPQNNIKLGYVWPRDSNPFKRHQEINVDYSVADSDRNNERTKKETTRLKEVLSGPKGEFDRATLASAAFEKQPVRSAMQDAPTTDEPAIDIRARVRAMAQKQRETK
jgi:Protein of unknown function (DUF3987)